MKQTKKLVLAPLLGFLMLVNLAALIFTAVPLARAFQGNSTRLGLKLIAESNASISAFDIEKTAQVISSRLSALGVNLASVEPSQVEGEHLKVVIPAGNDIGRIKEVISYFGILELIPIAKDTKVPYPTREEASQAAKALSNTPFEILKYQEGKEESYSEKGWVIVEKTALITGVDFREARAVRSQYGVNNYEIAFTLSPEGASRFSDWTGKNVGEKLAIVLNREVKSAPMIQGQIADRGQITGGFTRPSAESLAIALSSGRLPYRVEIISEQADKASKAVQKQTMKLGGLSLTFLALFVGLLFVLTRKPVESASRPTS
jgi:preprotein translocase subunit SecD